MNVKSRKQPYKLPPLETDIIREEVQEDGSILLIKRERRGISSSIHETRTFGAESQCFPKDRSPRSWLLAYQSHWRQKIKDKGLKTDEEFTVGYKNLNNARWADQFTRYAELKSEAKTQLREAFSLVRIINFIDQNFTDEQIDVIQLFGSAQWRMAEATFNAEATVGRKQIDHAFDGVEKRALSRKPGIDRWHKLALELEAEVRASNPKLSSQIEIANKISDRFKELDPPIRKSGNTIARYLRQCQYR